MVTDMLKAPGSVWHLVVISESSGGGLGRAYAGQIEKDLGVKVVLDDFAISDLSAGEVVEALEAGDGAIGALGGLPAALREAEVVVMFANPMASVDIQTRDSINECFAGAMPTPCTTEGFGKYTADLEAIWAKVFELRVGQPTILRAIDVANPFVGQWSDPLTFSACTGCWECVSGAVRRAAEAYGIPFLSRYDAFNGARHDQDMKGAGYIGLDGIHPNDLAQRRTAELLAGLGYDTVPAPAQ